jgi:hypothetical protein
MRGIKDVNPEVVTMSAPVSAGVNTGSRYQ